MTFHWPTLTFMETKAEHDAKMKRREECKHERMEYIYSIFGTLQERRCPDCGDGVSSD